jgi:hypothetical protein
MLRAPTLPPCDGRVRRPLVVAAVLVLFALASIDCLNLIQSDTWSDLSQAPHMAAVSHAKEAGARPAAKRLDLDTVAVLTDALGLLLVVAVGVLAGALPMVDAKGARRRERERAPPGRPARPGIA